MNDAGESIKPWVDAELIDYVTRTIVERFHPERIILFGSQARGDARRDSDLDLCVVMETSQRPAQRTITLASTFKSSLRRPRADRTSEDRPCA